MRQPYEAEFIYRIWKYTDLSRSIDSIQSTLDTMMYHEEDFKNKRSYESFLHNREWISKALNELYSNLDYQIYQAAEEYVNERNSFNKKSELRQK